MIAIVILISVLTGPIRASQKLLLTRAADSKYALKAEVANLNIELEAHLSGDLGWIKMDGCQVCEMDTCSGSCFEEAQYGVKCSESYCKEVQGEKDSIETNEVLKGGKTVKLKMRATETNQNITITTVLAQKMEKKLAEIGRINLLSQQELFGESVIFVKDHSKDITVHYPGKDSAEDTRNSIQYLHPVIGLEDEAEAENDKNSDEEGNIFQISQIKIRDLTGSTVSGSGAGTVLQGSGEHQVELGLTRTHAEFSIFSSKLLLPSVYHKKLMNSLIDNYLRESKCKVEHQKIKCENTIKIDQLDNVTLALTLNGVEVEFPIRALITGCEKKSCELLVGVSKQKKMVVIGDFILNLFGLQYNHKNGQFSLLRLNNQWGKNFQTQRKYAKHEVNFFLGLFLIVFYTLYWVFKVIVYLAAISLAINCCYHWRSIMAWMLNIRTKLEEKKRKVVQSEQDQQVLNERVSSDEDE